MIVIVVYIYIHLQIFDKNKRGRMLLVNLF